MRGVVPDVSIVKYQGQPVATSQSIAGKKRGKWSCRHEYAIVWDVGIHSGPSRECPRHGLVKANERQRYTDNPRKDRPNLIEQSLRPADARAVVEVVPPGANTADAKTTALGAVAVKHIAGNVG
jgi:hypothetical protein